MATDGMFDSSVRSKGDLAGVFEYDGDTGYFYLYETGDDRHQKVVGAIRITPGEPDFEQVDLAVRWNAGETKVGLFIRGELCAAFDGQSRAKYGGDYRAGAQAQIPAEVRMTFRPSKIVLPGAR